MATSRWDGNVHFWDYTAESPELYPGMDAFRVGEAYIYNKKGTVALGMVVVVTGHDILGGVTLDQAIRRARAFLKDMTRPGLSGTPQEEVETLEESRTYLFTLEGRKIAQIFP
jgi:hypothetical protein